MNAPRDPGAQTPILDLAADFPILARPVHGRRLAYLDNGATTQKPAAVIEAEARFYRESNANIHRGVHWLSQHATELYDGARATVQGFVNAARADEIVFTRGTTEAINLVAQSWGRPRLAAGDEILLSTMEHHSNIVPWQLVCEQTGAVLKVIPVQDNGELDMAAFEGLLGERTRLLAITHVSNALGTVYPVAEMTRRAHEVGAVVLVDGAQAVAHQAVDVQAIGCDFYAFSGHKLYGPTGIGVLYGRAELLEQMPPWQTGGEMIQKVSFSGTRFNPPPFRFEAGTPPIAEAIGLAAALDFLAALPEGWRRHEAALLQRLLDGLQQLPFIERVGTPSQQVGVVSLRLGDIHPQDAGELLDQMGIAVRVGHHCAMPLMESLGLDGTLRISLALYNSEAEVDALLAALARLPEFLG